MARCSSRLALVCGALVLLVSNAAVGAEYVNPNTNSWPFVWDTIDAGTGAINNTLVPRTLTDQ